MLSKRNVLIISWFLDLRSLALIHERLPVLMGATRVGQCQSVRKYRSYLPDGMHELKCRNVSQPRHSYVISQATFFLHYKCNQTPFRKCNLPTESEGMPSETDGN